MSTLLAKSLDGSEYPVEQHEITWRPSAYGIVIKDDKILLSPQHGKGYDLPGGGVDFDETLEEAVIREVKEETGIDVTVDKLVNVRKSLFVWKPNDPTERSVQQSLMLYYLCNVVGGELSTDGFDAYEKEYAQVAEWVPINDIERIGVANTVDFRSIVTQAMGMINGN